MANLQIIEYVRKSKEQGISDQSIRDELARTGWQMHEIDEAFSTLINPPSIPVAPSLTTAYTTSPSNSQQVVRHKAPLFVIIVAWLMLIGGVFTLLGVLPLLLLGGFGKSGIIFLLGVINLIKGAGLVAVSFGIRYMRKWALYTFTVLTIIAAAVSLYTFFTTEKPDIIVFADTMIQVLVLVYFWAVAKKFT